MNKLFLIFTCIFLFGTSINAQTKNVDDCNKIINQIEKLLLYKEKSPNQLRSLMTDLKFCLGEENQVYNQLNIRVNGNLLPIDIKLVKSDIYNKRFIEGAKKVPKLKLQYSYNEEITKLEKFVDKKIFSSYKKNVLRKKPSYMSIEPSFSLSTSEQKIDGFNKVNTSIIYPIFGIAVYGKFNQKSKSESISKATRYSYSQVGIKIEYRDSKTILFSESQTNSNVYDDYGTIQLSLLIRKCLGIDLGILNYRDNGQLLISNQQYTGALSLFIPIHFISFGVSSKLITDLKSDHSIQFALGTKINIGFFKLFTKADREEINTKIMLLKEK